MWRLPRVLGLSIVVSQACACALLGAHSYHDFEKSWLGAPIERYEELNGPADSISSGEGGDKVYRFKSKGPSPLTSPCVQYWIVNQKGRIIGYRHTGYCRLIG